MDLLPKTFLLQTFHRNHSLFFSLVFLAWEQKVGLRGKKGEGVAVKILLDISHKLIF